MTPYDEIVRKVLVAESPGMRNAHLVGSSHVEEGDNIVTLVVFDKEPFTAGDFTTHERRWVVVVSDKEGKPIGGRVGDIVSTRFEKVDE